MVDWNDTQLKLAFYIVYGTSFIVMFLVIAMWRKRIRNIEFMSDFKYLAAFALLHGMSQYSDIPRLMEWQPIWAFDFIKLILISSSFAALLTFGLSVISVGIEERRWLHGLSVGALLMYFWLLIVVCFTNSKIGINYTDAYNAADLAQRYSLGFFGAAISSYVLLDLGNKMDAIAGENSGKRFILAGIFFALYTIFGCLIVTSMLGVPIVVYRAIIAALMTIAVIRIFQLFEVKTPE